MRVLAIDAARTERGVALLRDGDTVAEESLGQAPGFGETLFDALDRLLKNRSVELAEMDGFAAATGPGPASVSSPPGRSPRCPAAHLWGCRAYGLWPHQGRGSRARSSRRGELFVGYYDGSGEAVAPEAVGLWDALAPQVGNLSARIVSNEPALFEADGPAAAAAQRPRCAGPAWLAGPIARLAATEIAAGGGLPPEAVEANYIQRPSARPPRPAQAAKR